MTDECLDDGFGRETLVDEERQCGNVEGKALCLPCPIEKRAGQTFQLLDGLSEAADGRDDAPVGLGGLFLRNCGCVPTSGRMGLVCSGCV